MADSKEKIFMQAFDDKKNIIGEILFGPTTKYMSKIYLKWIQKTLIEPISDLIPI